MALPSDWPKDITKDDVQNYLNQFYLRKDAPAHQALKGEGNRCVLNINTASISDKELMSFPQSVVNVVMKGIASNEETTNKGMLVWWSTGSGKACCATGVMDAFWDTDKNIVFATSVEAFNSNPPSNFHKCAGRFFPRFQGKSSEVIKAEFEKRKVKFFTFAQLAHYLLIANPLKRVKKNADIQAHQQFLDNAVLIIDEVHNIFKPLPNQKVENDAVKKFLLNPNNPLAKKLKIVILTATPGDTPDDVVTLLNIVKDKSHPQIVTPDFKNPSQLAHFKQSIQGLISYFDMSRDYTKYPKIVEQNKIVTHMSYSHFKRYAQAYNEEPNTLKNADALLKQNQIGKYYKHARRYSNMLFDMDKDMMINEFSSKLPALLENIKQYPNDKHYVYSSFYENRGYGGHGILAIAKALETEMGFQKWTSATNARSNGGGKYVLAISSEVSDNREKLKALVTAFNSPENAHGEKIQIFLASQGYNEGVDLKGVKHVHIFEPLLTFAADKQTIGRAARYCSHSDLEWGTGEWTVKVHRYISAAPVDLSMFNMNYLSKRVEYLKGEVAALQTKASKLQGSFYDVLRKDLTLQIDTYQPMIRELEKKAKEVTKMNLKNVKMVDEQITKEAIQRTREMLVLYKMMKEASVDYLLFKDFHNTR
jgi:hypothetical protein